MFNDLNTDGLEKTKDTLGGFQVLDTDAYKGVIKALYAGKADSGARNVTLIITLEDGSEYSETIYVTNKAGETFYVPKNDSSKKVPLPGFTRMNELFLAHTGKPINDASQVWETKQFKVWNSEAREALPTAVQMATDLIGKEILFTVVKELHDKTTKQGNQYVPTGETINKNAFTQVFDVATRKSVNEAIDGKDAEFLDKWIAKNKGKVFDRTDKKAAQQGGAAGRPPSAGGPPASGGAAEGKSIFGN